MKKSISEKKEERRKKYEAEQLKMKNENPILFAFKNFKYALETFEGDNIELAGFEFYSDSIKSEINNAYRLLKDVRTKSGLYGLIVSDKPKLIKPNKTKLNNFGVDALTLLNRYCDLKHFIMESSDIYYKNIFYSFGQINIYKAFQDEIKYLNEDKELALYWYIIFNFLENDNLNEISKIISGFNWEMIVGAKEYFKTKEHSKIKSYDEKIHWLRNTV